MVLDAHKDYIKRHAQSVHERYKKTLKSATGNTGRESKTTKAAKKRLKEFEKKYKEYLDPSTLAGSDEGLGHKLGGVKGYDTMFYYAGKGGRPTPIQAEYRLVEADEMIPSHDPETLRPSGQYPKDLQERVYHIDDSEKSKVRNNAQFLIPALMVNTNPDALNGPPIMTEEGVVLGGNSRAMSLQLAYKNHPEKGSEVKDYLKEHKYQFGLKDEDFAGMKNPVLVRVMNTKDQDKKILVRAMNEGFTQGMDARAKAVALGRRLSDETLKTLADGMKADDTLSTFLSSSRADDFITQLAKDGVIDHRNENQYKNKNTKKLNADGKTLVERILVGRVVEDPDLLSNTRSSMVSALARAIPHILQAEAAGKSWSLKKPLKDALYAFNSLEDRNMLPTAKQLKDKKKAKELYTNVIASLQGMALGGDSDTPESRQERDIKRKIDAVYSDPKTKILLETLVLRGGPVQMARTFKSYAQEAQANSEAQGGLFVKKTPEEVLEFVTTNTAKKMKKEKEEEEAEKKKRQEEKERKKQEASQAQGGLFGKGGFGIYRA